MSVPRVAVGVVIGKGGDMIKKIQDQTGARVQFLQAEGDEPVDRVCMLLGNVDQINEAKERVEQLISDVLVSCDVMIQVPNNHNYFYYYLTTCNGTSVSICICLRCNYSYLSSCLSPVSTKILLILSPSLLSPFYPERKKCHSHSS